MSIKLPRPKRKYLRIALWSGGILLLLPILLYAALAIYVNTHKAALLKTITDRLSEDMHGTMIVEDMEPSLWGDFPFPSVALRNVHVRDSQWARHHRDLLHAKQIYLRLNPIKLISNRVDVRKLTVSHGGLYIFTDSNGYTNGYVLAKKKENESKGKEIAFHKFTLEDMEIRLDQAPKNKSYGIYIKKLDGTSDRDGDVWTTVLKTNALVRRLGFNLGRGAFLTNTKLQGTISLVFDRDKASLTMRAPALDLDGQSVNLLGELDVSKKPSSFSLKLDTKKIPYSKAMAWMSRNISSKLTSFDFAKPIDVKAVIEGRIEYKDTPYVMIQGAIRDNTLIAPFAKFEDCSFDMTFLNVVAANRGHADANSRIIVEHLKARYQSIPFSADTVEVTNLIYPSVYFKLHSDFPLKALNELQGDLPVSFSGGKAVIDVRYKGGIRTDDTLYPFVQGAVNISDAAFEYTARGMQFSNTAATLRLQGDDLFLENVKAQTPGGVINMKGEALHFFRFYFTDPGKVSLAWQGSSPALDLTPFSTFIGARKKRDVAVKASPAAQSANVSRIVNGLNNVLEECTADLRLSLGSLKYGSFTARNVRADASLAKSAIDIRNVSLEHAGGTVAVSGKIHQTSVENPFSIHVALAHVGIPEFFRGLDNFGQDALTADNMDGSVTANVDATGRMTDGGKVVQKSLSGGAKYSLEGGRLRNFAPFARISKIAFRNRGLDDVQFEKIESTLDFDRGSFVIHPLVIRSSAFNMQIQGRYGPPTGTDIAIVLPLGKPKNEKRAGKDIARGLVVYLRAKDGKDGVAIDWDPMKRGKKETDKQFEE